MIGPLIPIWRAWSILSAFVLRLLAKPSRDCFILISTVYVLAVAGSFLCALTLALKIMVSGVLVLHWGCLLRSGRLYGMSGSALLWRAPGAWAIQHADGRIMPVRVLGSSFVSRWLTVVHVRSSVRRCHALSYFRDSLDAESYRLLRVYLNTRAALSN